MTATRLHSIRHKPMAREVTGGSPMPCPSCHEDHTAVVDSRPLSGAIRRRRYCLKCHARFTTFEVVAARPPASTHTNLNRATDAVQEAVARLQLVREALDGMETLGDE